MDKAQPPSTPSLSPRAAGGQAPFSPPLGTQPFPNLRHLSETCFDLRKTVRVVKRAPSTRASRLPPLQSWGAQGSRCSPESCRGEPRVSENQQQAGVGTRPGWVESKPSSAATLLWGCRDQLGRAIKKSPGTISSLLFFLFYILKGKVDWEKERKRHLHSHRWGGEE